MIEFVYPHTHLVAGVDEVGRGPLVGAVVTAAVILDPARPIVGLNDSKKLSEKRRLSLYDEIKEKALSWSLGRAEAHEIDELNILHATMLAMQRAVAGLHIAPEYVLIDGNRCPELPVPSMAVVKGDSRVAEISAASILAKVTRDAEYRFSSVWLCAAQRLSNRFSSGKVGTVWRDGAPPTQFCAC